MRKLIAKVEEVELDDDGNFKDATRTIILWQNYASSQSSIEGQPSEFEAIYRSTIPRDSKTSWSGDLESLPTIDPLPVHLTWSKWNSTYTEWIPKGPISSGNEPDLDSSSLYIKTQLWRYIEFDGSLEDFKRPSAMRLKYANC
jgi:hypothetical protein